MSRRSRVDTRRVRIGYKNKDIRIKNRMVSSKKSNLHPNPTLPDTIDARSYKTKLNLNTVGNRRIKRTLSVRRCPPPPHPT